MKQAVLVCGLSSSVLFAGAGDVESLPDFLVHSTRVAVQQPTSTFSMPVSVLRFEPLVDVQARNLAEGQSDVAIRGGTFENTGFKIGALNMYDPQTGHYFAEIPVAPAMLSAPHVLVGYDNAAQSWNATTGTVAYGWRRITISGAATVSFGDFDTRRGELYQGWVSPVAFLGRRLAADVSVSSSRSDGSLPWGEHAFDRTNVRLQLSDDASQTDLFYGYQAKQFGWPNLYTPFANVKEQDRLQTVLAVLNHRQTLATGHIEAGVFFRRNKDHYIFNRPEAGAFNPAFGTSPSFHTTWTGGASVSGEWIQSEVSWNWSVLAVTDKIRSTSLNFGRSRARDQYRAVLAPSRTWSLAGGRKLELEAGAAWDDSNRGSAEVSPMARLSWLNVAPSVGLDTLFVAYSQSTQLPTYTALNSRPSAGLFRGNANLGREVSRTVEIGATGTRGRWSAQVSLFARQDEDLVDWTYASSLPNARAANAVDIDNLGFEAVVRRSGEVFDLVLGYTAHAKDADYGSATVDSSFYALNYPLHRATAAAIWRLGHGVELRVDNEYRIQEKDALRKSSRRAFLTSSGLYYSPAALRGLRLGVEVENLWDDDFQEVPAVPAARRQWSAGLTYVW